MIGKIYELKFFQDIQILILILVYRYTADEDFLNADAVFDCIGDPPEERFDLAFCGSLLEKKYVS